MRVNDKAFRALNLEIQRFRDMSDKEFESLMQELDESEAQSNIQESLTVVPPNAFRELMPPSQTFGEGDG